MARVTGLEKKQAPWHLRWFYNTMRKMFGKDLTPLKLQMRKPGLVWGSMRGRLARALVRLTLTGFTLIELCQHQADKPAG